MDIGDETMLRLLQSAMYGEAIGDALGVPYEGRMRDTFTCITMTCSEAAGIPAGTFSDDTSMALATLDSLMHRDGVVDPDDLRERYRDWLFDGKYTADGAAFGVGRTNIPGPAHRPRSGRRARQRQRRADAQHPARVLRRGGR